MLESALVITMSIVFMGTPEFAVPSLYQLWKSGPVIDAVYTQPDRPSGRGRHLTPPAVKKAALEIGLPVHQPQSLHTQEEIKRLLDLQPEAIIVCAYGEILRANVLRIPPKGAINAHASLLPRHRGATPIPASILAGDKETGATIMLMNSALDSGPILYQQPLPISPLDTARSLSDKLGNLSADLLVETLPRWLSGKIEPQPQDNALASFSTHLTKDQGIIDWSLTAEEIWRLVRAYNPWPGAHTDFQEETIYIWEAWPLKETTDRPPGSALTLSATQLAQLPPELSTKAFGVQSGQGILAVITAQRAGRRRLAALDLTRGLRGLIGGQFSQSQARNDNRN